jgi:hypothetical protein
MDKISHKEHGGILCNVGLEIDLIITPGGAGGLTT